MDSFYSTVSEYIGYLADITVMSPPRVRPGPRTSLDILGPGHIMGTRPRQPGLCCCQGTSDLRLNGD